MKKEIVPYYVINWDFNSDKLEFYNVMPYFIDRWKTLKKSRSKYKVMPTSFEEFKSWLKEEAMYQFWARAQYECVVTGWPAPKNAHKLDIYQQLEANLDLFTRHFMLQIK